MKKSIGFILDAILAGPGGAGGRVRLTLAGSSTVRPGMEEAAQACEKTHTDVAVDGQGGGSSVGMSAPQSKPADILAPSVRDLNVRRPIGLIFQKPNQFLLRIVENGALLMPVKK